MKELFALVERLGSQKIILFSKFDSKCSNRTKTLAWQWFTEEVNLVSQLTRDPLDVRTKYRDMRSSVKKKAAMLRR